MQMYFDDNPRDLQLLRHDKDLHPAIIKPHLRNVPEYLSKTFIFILILHSSYWDIQQDKLVCVWLENIFP